MGGSFGSSHELAEVSIVSQLATLLGFLLLRLVTILLLLLLLSRLVLGFRLLCRSLLLLLGLLLAKHISETKLAHSVAVRDITFRATQLTLSFKEIIFDRFLLLLRLLKI